MVLQVENLGYWYTNERPLFQQVNLTFEPRKMYAILGTSGSGKTTFLSLLAGLDQPKEGQITYQGESLKQIGLQNYRKNRVSIVFQAYNLLPYLSAVENVLTAMAINQTQKDNPKEYAYQQLKKVGLTRELADKRVSHLSSGQHKESPLFEQFVAGMI